MRKLSMYMDNAVTTQPRRFVSLSQSENGGFNVSVTRSNILLNDLVVFTTF